MSRPGQTCPVAVQESRTCPVAVQENQSFLIQNYFVPNFEPLQGNSLSVAARRRRESPTCGCGVKLPGLTSKRRTTRAKRRTFNASTNISKSSSTKRSMRFQRGCLWDVATKQSSTNQYQPSIVGNGLRIFPMDRSRRDIYKFVSLCFVLRNIFGIKLMRNCGC